MRTDRPTEETAAISDPARRIEPTTVNDLGAVTGGERVVSRPLKIGGRTIVVESEVWSNDRLVAKVTQTQIVLTA